MLRPTSYAALALLALLALLAACGGGEGSADSDTAASATDAASTSPAGGAVTASFTAADVEAYERGLAKEIELVHAAQERARTATTPEERGAAMQAQWEDQTIPEGARSAGLSEERYRQIRTAVHGVLQTLDFQGKIEGPLSMDTARADAEMKARLARDAYADLDPASADALRARMPTVLPQWLQYVTLTAVAG